MNDEKKIFVSLPGDDKLKSGIVSQISFENPSFREGLNTMFGTSDREEIIAIKVTKDYIRAYFQNKSNE